MPMRTDVDAREQARQRSTPRGDGRAAGTGTGPRPASGRAQSGRVPEEQKLRPRVPQPPAGRSRLTPVPPDDSAPFQPVQPRGGRRAPGSGTAAAGRASAAAGQRAAGPRGTGGGGRTAVADRDTPVGQQPGIRRVMRTDRALRTTHEPRVLRQPGPDAGGAAAPRLKPEAAPGPERAQRPAGARGPARAPGASRTPFVLLVLGLLGGGLVCLLIINTTLSTAQFRITHLQQSNATLSQQEQSLQQEIAKDAAPATIFSRAWKLGMRPQQRLQFLDVRTGRIERQPAKIPGVPFVVVPPGYTP
jgi:hypothetical protein